MALITSLFIGGTADGELKNTNDYPHYRVLVPIKDQCVYSVEDFPVMAKHDVHEYRLERFYCDNIVFTMFVKTDIDIVRAFSKLIMGYSENAQLRKDYEAAIKRNVILYELNNLLTDKLRRYRSVYGDMI